MSYSIMQCPFCSLPMQTIDNGILFPYPLSMIWKCQRCPQEVCVLARKDQEEHWVLEQMSIFVVLEDRKYALHWHYQKHFFEILEVEISEPMFRKLAAGHILRFLDLPINITPINAAEKLRTYLTFS